MSFGSRKIIPIDTRPGTGVGIGLPFNTSGVFLVNYTTKEAIRNNLINYFLTNKGERYMNPNFGGNLRAFIFQQINEGNIDSLKEDIQYQLGLYFQNILLKRLDVNSSPDDNSISIELYYLIKDTGVDDTIQLSFI